MLRQPHQRNVSETTLTIVYDNNPFTQGLKTAWGFACVAEVGSTMVLFDTGGDGTILMENIRKLGIDPAAINAVILSHNHYDHTGGLDAFLKVKSDLEVYIPASFPPEVSDRIKQRGAVPVTVDSTQHIVANIYTLGEIGGSIPEQSMILKASSGLVVVTGCAHPGISNILHRAKAAFPDDTIHLVLGGFHLGKASDRELSEIVDTFKKMGVEKLAPCHCTGAHAIRRFQKEFGDQFIIAGVGGRFEIKPDEVKEKDK